MRRPDPLSAGRRRWVLGLAALPLAGTRPSVAQIADVITVTGDVRQTLTLGVVELKAFDTRARRELRERRDAGSVQRDTTVRGVALAELLLQAGLAERDRLDWRKTVVVAVARDGYRAAFSWPELVNTEGGAQVMVAYERDGQPLPPGDGPLAVMAPADQRTGPRHVKALARLEVRILRD